MIHSLLPVVVLEFLVYSSLMHLIRESTRMQHTQPPEVLSSKVVLTVFSSVDSLCRWSHILGIATTWKKEGVGAHESSSYPRGPRRSNGSLVNSIDCWKWGTQVGNDRLIEGDLLSLVRLTRTLVPFSHFPGFVISHRVTIVVKARTLLPTNKFSSII